MSGNRGPSLGNRGSCLPRRRKKEQCSVVKVKSEDGVASNKPHHLPGQNEKSASPAFTCSTF